MLTTYAALMTAYLESLKDKAAYDRSFRVASQWILHQQETPTRQQLIARMLEKGKGDYQPGCQQANKELAIQRAAFRWGLYHDKWHGGDPTVGIKKFKTKKRKRIAKFLEIRALLDFFEFAQSETDIRNRALYGVALLTGCRPSEVRTARLGSIVPYGNGGAWNKGQTKTGEEQEIPLPSQAMRWVEDWLAVRATNERYKQSPWIFPGQDPREPIGEDATRKGWQEIRDGLRLNGLWNYDLRRTLASYMSNELGQSDIRVQAILNHSDGRALSHYCHVSFDAMVGILQGYADWLFNLKGEKDHVPTTHHVRASRDSVRTLSQ
jgi:integrase